MTNFLEIPESFLPLSLVGGIRSSSQRAPDKIALRDRHGTRTYAQLVGRDAGYALLNLSSGEVRMVLAECMASIGAVSNPDQQNIKLGKAGRKRWQGKRPSVRGVAMNPVDHPHGGGEGRSSGGRHPVTPWGKPTKGKRTRKKNKPTDALIVRSRHRK